MDRSSARPAVLEAGERLARDTFALWDELQDSADVAVVEVGEVLGEVDHYMSYGLGSYDAVHAATAAAVGRLIVTTDADFARVPSAELAVVTDPTVVAKCRAIRSSDRP